MFIVKWILLLPVRIIAFILSLLLTIIRVFIDVVAKMASFAAGPLLFLVVGWLVYFLVKQNWNNSILFALIGGSIITVYYVAGFISAELDYLASLLMDFVRP